MIKDLISPKAHRQFLSCLTPLCLVAMVMLFSLQVAAQNTLQAFKLSDVRLLPSPFFQAEQTDKTYMLSLNADRLLAPYLKEAGLQPKAASYGNWENTGLDGHIGGHYLSALSLMYAATGDQKVKARLEYMINELEKCQIKNGNGYLSGVPDGKVMWAQVKAGNIQASGFSLNDRWVPLYNIHKTIAGLHDAYAIAGNAKAKGMLIKLADWFVDLVANLSDQQIQQLLRSEHGGLNEVFANVYTLTGDKKYLRLARQFSDEFILNPLLHQKDALNGLHANTQIPKVIGFEQIALADRDTAWAGAANFFWNTVVKHRTVAIGGNSVREHFHPASDFSSMMESREGPETCNSYNMLKLTRQLFLSAPSNDYLDYYERTLYNHILSSQRPQGGFVYFTPMRPGHYRTYSSPQESFWCCVGSGLENHAKYGELIYAHDQQNLYVNLFIPSVLSWKAQGITLTQETSFPEKDYTTLKLGLTGKKKFALCIRRPSWVATEQFSVSVNGKPVEVKNAGNGYVSVNRTWASGDLIRIDLPMKVTAEFLPDGSDWVAFLKGPVVMAAEIDTLGEPNLTADGSRMGHIASGALFPASEAPLIYGDSTKLASQLISDPKQPLVLHAKKVIFQPRFQQLKLVPFYRLAEKRYIVYFPYAAANNLAARAEIIRKNEAERTKLEQETVDVITTGEQQPENDHHFKGEKTEAGIYQDRHFRNGTGWFSYQLRNQKSEGKKIRLTFYGRDKDRSFSMLINGTSIAQVEPDGSKGDSFYTQDFAIPEHLRTPSMELKLMADKDSAIPGIYEIRLVR